MPMRSLSVAVIKPLDVSWEQAGRSLRLVQKACVPAANFAQTALLRADADLFGSLKADENGEPALPRKGKKLALPPIDKSIESSIYEGLRSRFPHVSSRIITFLQQDIRTRYIEKRFDIAIGKASVPSYRRFAFQQDSYRLVETENGDFEINLTLLSKEAKGIGAVERVRFLLDTFKFPADSLQVLSEIASGKRKAAAVRVTLIERKNKWIVSFPYEKEKQEFEPVKDRILHVYPPGKGIFLRCAVFVRKPARSPTDTWSVPIEFTSAIQYRKSYEKRAKEISAKYRQDSCTGSRGHGRKRALRAKERYQAAYGRATHTHNQQRAAFIIQQAVRWKCSSVEYTSPPDIPVPGYNLIETWPWYDLEQSIKTKAEEYGIEFRKIEYAKEGFEKLLSDLDQILTKPSPPPTTDG